jgi:cell wall-associated NlpC family hydrolase
MKYIGLPYKFGGRDAAGLDCLGLVQMFYLDEFGIELPEYLYGEEFKSEQCAQAIERGEFDGNWRRVNDAQYGDLLVYRVMGQPTHVAVDAGNGLLLHAFQGRNTCLEPLEAWAHRLMGRFRWHTM